MNVYTHFGICELILILGITRLTGDSIGCVHVTSGTDDQADRILRGWFDVF